jgi:uncharacterized protein
MVSTTLSRLVRVSVARPAITIMLALALASVAVFYAARTLTFQASSLEFLPQHQLYVQRFKDNLREFGELNDIVVAVEAPDLPTARAYADRLAIDIRAVPGVKRVAHRIDPDDFAGQALLFLSMERLAEIRDKVLEHRRFIEAYAARPTLAGLFDALSTEIARRFATGFVDLSLDDGSPERFDTGFLDALLQVVADSLEGPTPVAAPWERVFSPGLEAGAGYFRSADDRLLFILVESARDVTSFTDNEHLIAGIRGRIASLRATYPNVQAGVTGAPALSNDEMLTAFRDSTAATILAFVLTLGSLLIVIRRMTEPWIMLGVLVVSLAWTLGIIAATVGHLTVFSVMFISLLVGLGIDYGVYVLLRYDRELALGPTPREALQIMARRTGPGILFGALTAAGTFGVLMLTEFRGIQEFGFIAGTSLLMAFLAMMTVFPAALLVMRRHTSVRRDAPRGVPSLVDEQIPALERLLDCRAFILLAATLLTVGGLAALPGVRFDYNRLNLQARTSESVAWERRIAQTRRSGFSALATADSLPELRTKQEAFGRLPVVAEVVSALKLIPSDQGAKIATIRQLGPILSGVRIDQRARDDARATGVALQSLHRRIEMAVREAEGRTSIEPLIAAQSRAEALLQRLSARGPELSGRLANIDARLRDDFVAKLRRLQRNLSPTPVTIGELPEELRRKFVGVNGRFLIQIYPAIDTWERDGARDFVSALRTVDPAVTGSPVISYEATRLMELAYVQGTFYAIVLVALLAVMMLRRPVGALLAVTPVVLGTLWTIGFLRLFGLSFNLANIWGLPMIIGGAAEFGLNVTLRYRESLAVGGPEFPRSTVMAVVLNGLTTMAGFGSLMIARHQGIFGLGLLLTVGAACSLAASLVVLPLLLRRFDARPAEEAAPAKSAAAAAIVLLIAMKTTAWAGEPTDQIRTDINGLFQTLTRQPASQQAAREADSILDRMFDWTAMASAALREHWAARTPAERDEFTRLFAAVFRRAYAARVHLVDASRFQYLGDSIADGHGTVQTKVMTKRGSTIDVDYAVHRNGAPRWLVEDVRVEKISLVDSYRVQFDTLIRRSSYDTLVKRLRDGAMK